MAYNNCGRKLQQQKGTSINASMDSQRWQDQQFSGMSADTVHDKMIQVMLRTV